MDKIVIQGGRKLEGEVEISGSKNAALPIMAASLLSAQSLVLSNVPDLKDIQTLSHLLEGMGVKIKNSFGTWKLQAKEIKDPHAPYDLVRTMRASILVLGPLLARTGRARVSLPGGCAIGARPIDRHLRGFEQMGAHIELQGGYVEAKAKKLKGAQILFEDVTVTGTENMMMAATLAIGTTILGNAAREPEVVDLANVLKQMGAKITGAGTDTITIEGVPLLHDAEYQIMADRIEAGTFLMGVCMTGGELTARGLSAEYLGALIAKLEEVGAHVEIQKEGIFIKAPSVIKNANVVTQPYPGFATDFQAQYMALMTLSSGVSLVTENIFENRYMHIAELARMGADIKLEGKTAIIQGVPHLIGAPVMATDLRAGASLVLAGLAAHGISEIHRVYHIDRGYEHIEKKFRKLGARIKRTKVKY
ncbi:MAG: UDP-N-acetylglucosamine 1-carboxyvinyltransferase [Deltaproteobacteria bacterium RIFCSPLOWO2_12_FULL_40_28]|nr:MAG: UDP-N-acetylglucosamine 1-carboxyvinyltransferase [Deltaproteobacteria bacterium RIFCSPHIGHO2_02_FULL_40_28]OGQ19503.1 MAG: UDP-N-acetylglucosamine 1-carboxyvinyltransferase [Deltaproteobacteria bacterium RIFCSPHIGHO2_12_FULL_40_32]OGQ39977.1 MAG: UDP-N-acetylglucosamine 1-carboxyvinyltransferase [Deltaproteobacteria bacterium RIFCSPLOWO2_02_FULL_40_36]OGQ54350.1 MAG: UDP-N-acetylglucosamine 1-carboxyvinyltransferase [Deltaproteobacteria bacterium RIFCSPLOWO2_12_FULL_40_28]